MGKKLVERFLGKIINLNNGQQVVLRPAESEIDAWNEVNMRLSETEPVPGVYGTVERISIMIPDGPNIVTPKLQIVQPGAKIQ